MSVNLLKLGKLSSVYMLGSIIPQVIGVFLLPVFTAYLIPEQFGIIRLAIQIVAPLSIMIQLGLWSALKSNYFRVEEYQQKQLVSSVFIGQLVQAVLVCVALSGIGIWLAPVVLPNLPLEPNSIFILWLIIVWQCFFDAIIRLATGLSQLQEKAVLSVSFNLIKFFVQIGLGLFFVVMVGWKGLGRQATVFMGAIAAGLFAFLWLFKSSGIKFSLQNYIKNLKLGLTFVPHGLAAVLVLSVNSWLLVKLDSAASFGVYSIAMQFAMLVQLPLLAFGNAAYPSIAKLMKKGDQQSRQEQSNIYLMLITMVIIIIFGIIVFAPIAIELLTAPEYHGAKTMVLFLSIAWLFQGFYHTVSQTVFYFGGGIWLSLATVTSIVVSFIVGIWLIPIYGGFGAAISMMAAFFSRFVVVKLISLKMYILPWEYLKIFFMLIFFSCLIFIEFFIRQYIGNYIVSFIFKSAVFISLLVVSYFYVFRSMLKSVKEPLA